MSVRSSEVMKEKELYLREFAREGCSALPAGLLQVSRSRLPRRAFARTRIYAILINGCRF